MTDSTNIYEQKNQSQKPKPKGQKKQKKQRKERVKPKREAPVLAHVDDGQFGDLQLNQSQFRVHFCFQ